MTFKTGKPHVSFSEIKVWKECPYRHKLTYVDKIDMGDEVFQFDDLKIFVDPKSSLFLIGTQVDYVEGELESGFKFINPNEKGRCGCGESFHI